MYVDTKDDPKSSYFYKGRKDAYVHQNYGRGVSRLHTYDTRAVFFFSQGGRQKDGFAAS